MDNLRNKLKKINMTGELVFNEPMSSHTTFRTGGPADIYCAPTGINELKIILHTACEYSSEVFIIGGGANLLVSDTGIRGIVIDIKHFDTCELAKDDMVRFGAGVNIDTAAEFALEAGLKGLDSFYGMPGTVGGAVWMNARCYGRSISDIIVSAGYLDKALGINEKYFSPEDFDYKISPFQKMNAIILNAAFKLEKGDRDIIRRNMRSNREDREKKGHYAGASAGSIFKNNRLFGRPAGEIIDSLGLRGTAIGGAKISDSHANIFINTGNASSDDIYRLIRLTMEKVSEAYGFKLEPEVQFIGAFS